MPLFKRPPTPIHDTAPPRKRSTIFSLSRTDDNVATTTPATRTTTPPNANGATTGSPRRGTGFFRRRSTSPVGSPDVEATQHSRRRSVEAGTSSGATAGTGLLAGRSLRGGDRSFEPARSKVTLAEKAEKEADIALAAAKKAVVEARRHLQALEEEANEQARLAHEKVLGVRSLKNDASGLGRHMK